MNNLTDKQLQELQQECLDNLDIHPLVIQILEDIQKEIDNRLIDNYW